MPARTARFEKIDSLRACAALAVLVGHVALASGHGASWHGLADRFNVGVPIFFAISGFVLYRPFVAARAEGHAAPDARAYAVRRFLRIVPAYWLALTVLAIWPGLTGVFSGDFWVFYGFMQIYGFTEVGEGLFPAWTLCVEVTFYALLPLYALWMARRTRRHGLLRAEMLGLVALAVIPVLARAGMVLDDLQHLQLFSWLIINVDWFVPGMAMAVASVHLGRHGWAGLGPRAALACWAVAGVAFAALWLGPRQQYDSVVAVNVEAWLYMLVAAGLLAPLALPGSGGVIRRVMGHPLLIWLGVISYGIYLWHFPLAFWTWGQTGNVAVALVGTVALTIAFAAGSWYVLERPLLRVGRAYSARRRRAEPAGEGAVAVPATP